MSPNRKYKNGIDRDGFSSWYLGHRPPFSFADIVNDKGTSLMIKEDYKSFTGN